MTQQTRPQQAVMILILVALTLLLVACGQSKAEKLVAESTVQVLIPDDDRFRTHWGFTLEESADNYSVHSNWDPEYNPDIDKSLTVVSYQIGDPASWTGSVPAEDDLTEAAFVAVLTDSMGTGGPCETISADPEVVSCTYDVGNPDEMTVLVRRFETATGDAVLIVLGDGPASRDYVAGSFEAVAPAAAADNWLT